VSVDTDALVSATEAAAKIPGVSRHLIGMWRRSGKLEVKGRRGRSPLYRWEDILLVEKATRRAAWAANNHRARAS